MTAPRRVKSAAFFPGEPHTIWRLFRDKRQIGWYWRAVSPPPMKSPGWRGLNV